LRRGVAVPIFSGPDDAGIAPVFVIVEVCGISGYYFLHMMRDHLSGAGDWV
jgi:hypothetical protein